MNEPSNYAAKKQILASDIKFFMQNTYYIKSCGDKLKHSVL